MESINNCLWHNESNHNLNFILNTEYPKPYVYIYNRKTPKVYRLWIKTSPLYPDWLNSVTHKLVIRDWVPKKAIQVERGWSEFIEFEPYIQMREILGGICAKFRVERYMKEIILVYSFNNHSVLTKKFDNIKRN